MFKKGEKPPKCTTKPTKIQKRVKLFVEEYLRNGFNATQAYASSVASPKSNPDNWAQSASEFLRRPDVEKYLQERLEERKRQLHIDQAYIVRKYLEIVEADYVENTQYLTKDELDRMPKAARKLVTSIEMKKNTHTWQERYRDEPEESVEELYKVTFMSKDKALESLAKHTGTFMKDNVSLTGNLETKSFTDALKDLDI